MPELNNVKIKVFFNQATNRANLVSGEDIKTSFGKLSKAFDDGFNALVPVIDNGAKNIADMSKSSFTTLTKDSVTVTLSGDTITASGTGGTATNNFFNVFYVSNALLVPSGTWVISLVGTGINNFRVEEYDNAHSDVVKGDFGQPLLVTVPDNATQSYIRIKFLLDLGFGGFCACRTVFFQL